MCQVLFGHGGRYLDVPLEVRINGSEMGYNLLINGVYWGYNPLTNLFTKFLGHPSNRRLVPSAEVFVTWDVLLVLDVNGLNYNPYIFVGWM